MKKCIAILALLICVMVGTVSASARTWSTGSMTGTIGKYKVVMSLSVNESNKTVSGWYYYRSKGPKNKINLSGTYRDSSGSAVILEMDMKEKTGVKVTGYFDVTYSQYMGEISLDGDFTTSAGKRYTVNLSK